MSEQNDERGPRIPDRGSVFAWLGWGLAFLLAISTVVQTVRLEGRGEIERPDRPERAAPNTGGPPAAARPDIGGPEAPETQPAPTPPEGEGNAVAQGPPPPGEFACTLVLGFSQTAQWFLADSGFEQVVDGDQWELLWESGAGVSLWGDPEYLPYSRPPSSPCAERAEDPDRLLLTISGGGANPADWAREIRGAIAVAREKYPDIEQVVLQPVVGGPANGLCTYPQAGVVNATRNHPVIDEAIQLVVGGDVYAGPSPEVRTCEDYRDGFGHLTLAAAAQIGQAIGAFYAGAGS